MELTINLIFLTIVTIYMLLMGVILTMVYFDAEQRDVNGFIITSLVFFSGTIFGTLAWLIFRPKLQPQPIPVEK